MHNDNDQDTSPVAGHHTLGVAHNKSAYGDHSHDGENSISLLGGITISGSRSGGTALESVIAALVVLGAQDGTST